MARGTVGDYFSRAASSSGKGSGRGSLQDSPKAESKVKAEAHPVSLGSSDKEDAADSWGDEITATSSAPPPKRSRHVSPPEGPRDLASAFNWPHRILHRLQDPEWEEKHHRLCGNTRLGCIVTSDFSGAGSEFEILKQIEMAMQEQAWLSGRGATSSFIIKRFK